MRNMKRLSNILTVAGLHIERGGTVILHAINWRVAPGQHWVILGANGSGKTSLLSALTGYLMPTAGEVCLLGETYGHADWRELRKQIGLVSSSIRQMMADDEPALATVASGKYAMIDFWGRVTRTEKARALKLLAQVECEYLAARPWRVLSQGERQRVLIGRALMAKPRVLILDEPCAGLDPAAREQFLHFIQRLGEHRTFPDANPGDASRGGDHAGILARVAVEGRRGAGHRRKGESAEFQKFVPRLRRPDEIAQSGKPFRTEGGVRPNRSTGLRSSLPYRGFPNQKTGYTTERHRGTERTTGECRMKNGPVKIRARNRLAKRRVRRAPAFAKATAGREGCPLCQRHFALPLLCLGASVVK